MKDSSRTQGRLICAAAVGLGFLFLVGLLRESYWAVAIPVAVVVLFALGLSFWVGWTIATIQVEPFEDTGSSDSPPEAAPDQSA
jgi:hypothetical protein